MRRKFTSLLMLIGCLLMSMGTWAAEKTVTANLSKWTVDNGDGGSVTITDGVANITLGETKGNAVTLTSDQTYTGITKVELTLQTSDRSKETVAIKVGSESFESSYDGSILTIGSVSISSNNKDATATITPASAQDGSVVITIAQTSSSNKKTAVVKDVKITYTTEDSGKTVVSQTLNGVKIGSTALETSKYTVSGNVITLTDEYALNVPAVKLVNKITYSDDSTENEDVAVEGFKYSEGFFAGTAAIGSTTYTVKVPAKALSTTLADVTASTTWDWSKTGSSAVQLTDTSYPSKNDEFVLSNLIANTDDFNSDALKVQAEYAVRDGKYMQGGKVSFHTTVAGTIKVAFSNTGNRSNDEEIRYLYVNGTKTEFGSKASTANDVTTSEIAVEAGDVVLTAQMPKVEGTNQYIRLYSITFTATSQGGEGEEPGGEEGGEDIDPSTAKLLWDYTEAAPSAKPDNGLYYDANVNDAVGTKNGLKGVKLNSSGYAYFTKAAVKGTLKLTYGPRDGSAKSSLGIYLFTQDGETVTKGDKIAVTEEVTELSTQSIELTAEQNNIYIMRETTNEQVLTKIEFVPFVPRTFVDFKINFTKDWASSSTITGGTTYYVTATDADGVPTFTSEMPADGKYLCTFKGKYHGSAYGIFGTPTFSVPVDGAVKIYYGKNDYGADITAKNKAGETVLTGNSKGDKFSSDPANVMSMTYAKGEDVLTLTGGGYVPYFAVEACEVSPCTVTYKDQDGKVLGTKDTFEGEALGEIPYTAADITVPEGSAFRGWIYASGIKAKATDALNGNTTITALVTPIETVAVGTVQNYNLESAIFYPEDHETISIEGGNYYNNHGWDMAANGTISVDVAGNAQVVLKLCEYGNGTTITVTDANGSTVVADVPAKVDEGSDGAKYTFNYTGEPTTLTLTFAAQSYIHAISVYNVNDFVEKDAETGWYIVPTGDGAALILAINSANSEEGATIFLPNGTYDLGNTVLTTISGKNMSIIGESMEGTIIKTTALEEKLGVADLFYNTSTGLYMQDLTLQNDFDYYNSGSAGRAAVLQDNGNQTIMRNVAMRSYQDTYYSKQGNYYFEGGLIQGTVDYICGGGNAWFENITLLNKSRSATAKSGDDTMTAYNGTGMYVFNNCAVESECSTFNFGRSWADAFVVYLNTTIKSGKLINTRFHTTDMNSKPRFFGEYNTVDLSGNGMNTPESNILKTSMGAEFESVLPEDQAESFSYDSFFSGWDPKTIAAQVEEMPESKDGLVYLVDGKVTTTCPESGTVRIANSRGGFGPEIKVGTSSAINDINVEKASSANGKYLCNGRVIIRKDGKTYSTVGLEVK